MSSLSFFIQEDVHWFSYVWDKQHAEFTFGRELCSFQGKTEDVPTVIECILVLENAKIPKDLTGGFVRHVVVSSMVMKKLSGLQSIDGLDMVALASIPSTFLNLENNLQEEDCRTWFPFPHRILVLDGIQVSPQLLC